MKNYFYTTEVADRIKELFDNELPLDIAKNISVGDFTVLPAPDKLEEYLPAVIINVSEQDVTDSNLSLDIFTQQYTYDIYYLYPYTFKEFEDTPKTATKNAEYVANLLMNFRTLDDFKVESNDFEAGGEVITSAISKLDYDNAETKLFRSLDIPAHITHIEFYLAFRTYRGK